MQQLHHVLLLTLTTVEHFSSESTVKPLQNDHLLGQINAVFLGSNDVTNFPFFFWCLVFRAQFQHFLWGFRRSFLLCQARSWRGFRVARKPLRVDLFFMRFRSSVNICRLSGIRLKSIFVWLQKQLQNSSFFFPDYSAQFLDSMNESKKSSWTQQTESLRFV